MSVTGEQSGGIPLSVISELITTNNELPVTNNSITNNQSPIPQISKLRSTATIGKPIVQVEIHKVSVVQEPYNQTNRVFTFEELQLVWTKLIEDLEAKKRFSEFVILNRKFILDGTTIHIEVDNEIQVDLLTISLRTEILNHLRNVLQNSTIHLEVVVSKEEAKTMIYTQADKFKFMAEKNPALHELRSVLGLDYDY